MRSTKIAPDTLSNSYLTGSPPIGTSMSTLMLCGGLEPAGIRSMFMMARALAAAAPRATPDAADGMISARSSKQVERAVALADLDQARIAQPAVVGDVD